MLDGTAAAAGPDQLLPPWPGEEVELAGQRVFVRSGPQQPGRPIAVMVHGLGGASTNWTDLIGVLADELNTYVPDLPGFGFSPPPAGGRYSLDVQVGVVARLIERVADGPVHLFGNSLGGAVCVRLAAERPELVRTLTLVSPALPDRRPREGVDWRLGVMLLPGLAQAATWYLGRRPAVSRTRAVVELCFAHPERVPQERIDEAVAEMERRKGLAHSDDALVSSLRGLIATYFERGPRALWRQAAAVQAPTLLVWGRHDRLVHPAVGARAVRVFRRARLVVYEHCGHVAQMEDPRAVAAEWRALAAAAAGRAAQ